MFGNSLFLNDGLGSLLKSGVQLISLGNEQDDGGLSGSLLKSGVQLISLGNEQDETCSKGLCRGNPNAPTP